VKGTTLCFCVPESTTYQKEEKKHVKVTKNKHFWNLKDFMVGDASQTNKQGFLSCRNQNHFIANKEK